MDYFSWHGEAENITSISTKPVEFGYSSKFNPLPQSAAYKRQSIGTVLI